MIGECDSMPPNFTPSQSKKSNLLCIVNNMFSKEVTSNPYLGLNISDGLTWKYHINVMYKKKQKMIFNVTRVRPSKKKQNMSTLVFIKRNDTKRPALLPTNH